MRTRVIVLIVNILTCTAYIVSSMSNSSTRPTATSSGNPTMDSGFAQTCSSWGGFYGSDYAIMQATCANGQGGTNTTTINLNDCIGNAGPNLVCAKR